METLPQSVLDIIAAAVSQAVQQTAAAMQQEAKQEPERNYFKITEKLLYSYPTLKRIVSDKAAYTRVDLRERSKSVVKFNPGGQWKSRDDIIDELERDKEAEFDITARDFKKLDRVIQQFKERKEFPVVRLYYFNENADGSPRLQDAPEMTWEEVSLELGREAKTLRRYRNNIVNDMAICLFGIEAAIQAGKVREAKE